jgi:hypothetical protein
MLRGCLEGGRLAAALALTGPCRSSWAGSLGACGWLRSSLKDGPVHTPMMREGASLLGVSLAGRLRSSSMEKTMEEVFKFMATSADVTGHPRQGGLRVAEV